MLSCRVVATDSRGLQTSVLERGRLCILAPLGPPTPATSSALSPVSRPKPIVHPHRLDAALHRAGTHLDIPRPREIIPKLVKATGHDPIRRIKRLFDAVAVVDVDIDVQHAGVMAE